MTLEQLLIQLNAKSVRLRRNGESLILRAADGVMTPVLMQAIQFHKSRLLAKVDGAKDEWWLPPRVITPDMLPLVALSQEDIETILQATPQGASNIQDIYPLAPLQEGILFHSLMAKKGDGYLIPNIFQFDSKQRLDDFVGALQATVNRHDSLRTAFLWKGLPEPVQVVWRHAPLFVESLNLPTLEEDPCAWLSGRFDPAHCRIDLSQAPLLRLASVYDPEEECWLLMVLMHHLVGDRESLNVISEEVELHLLGQSGQLPVPTPYRNLVALARLGRNREAEEAFFKAMLSDVEEPTAPFGLLDTLGGFRARESVMEVEAGLGEKMRLHAGRVGASVGSLCHLAWALVLGRLTGRRDVVFGTHLFGRSSDGSRGVGLFMNLLPLRINYGQLGVVESLLHMHHLLAGLLRHEHAPLVLAQKCSGVQAPMPLFTSTFNYRHQEPSVFFQSQADQDTAEVAWEGIAEIGSSDHTNYPLNLDVDDYGDSFLLTVQGVDAEDLSGILSPERICAFVHASLASLVWALENAPDSPVASLDVMPLEEKALLHRWNATKTVFPGSPRLAHSLFERQADRNPQQTALIHAGESLSYWELNATANGLAQHLMGLGLRPDARVALCTGRCMEMIIAILGVMKAGGAYVPVDPAQPLERMQHLLQDSGAVLVLAEGRLYDSLKAAAQGLPVVDLSQAFPPMETNPDPASMGLNEHCLAYVSYTSGSTGLPKGVMVEHRSLWNLCHANQARYGITGEDRLLQFISFCFDGSLEEIFGAFMAGATLVLREDSWELSPRAFWEKCSDLRISVVDLPTRFWQLLASETHLSLPPSLRTVIIYGESVESRSLNTWFKRPGPLPRLFNTYGPTECTVNATIHEVTKDPLTWRSLGSPLANVKIYVLDGDFQPSPLGTLGELFIGGAGVGRGYLQRPALDAEYFLRDPFAGEAGARMYRTGDIARRFANGDIEILGRNDFQVKIRGFRIEPQEVEAHIKALPGIREAAVMAHVDRLGEKCLVAYLVSEGAVGVERVKAQLVSRLPEYMIPALFFQMDALPLTPGGKLNRQALPLPDGSLPDGSRRPYEAPQGVLENRLASLWSELLHIDAIGRHDHFFHLGGHSLLLIRMVAQLNRFGMDFSIQDVFAHPTIASLAKLARWGQGHACSDGPIVFRSQGTETPLFFAHEGSGTLHYVGALMQYLDPEIPIYGLGIPPADKKAITRSMRQMAQRMVGHIRGIQAEGPYRLAGWSFGGNFVFEVASQLMAQGESIEFLGLLDTGYLDNSSMDVDNLLDPSDNQAFIWYLEQIWKNDLDAETKILDLGRQQSLLDFEALVQRAHQCGLLSEGYSLRDIQANTEYIKGSPWAIVSYRPSPIQTKVHFFAAMEDDEDEVPGWKNFLGDWLEVIGVSGDHLSMMEGDNIKQLASAITMALHKGARCGDFEAP